MLARDNADGSMDTIVLYSDKGATDGTKVVR